MFRISKLADYGTLILSFLSNDTETYQSASEISEAVGLPLPTVRKVLRNLYESGLLSSTRGIQGGYKLSLAPRAISLARILSAFGDTPGLVECTSGETCTLENGCKVGQGWRNLDRRIWHILAETSLADLMAAEKSK